MATQTDPQYLFGGSKPWDSSLWIASDDRVRGGSSISYLDVTSPESARFHGNLDTQTLGGAGFASQRTIGELDLDLSNYAGVVLSVGAGASDHRFTFNLKDTLVPPSSNGREQAGITWEADFVAPKEGGDIIFSWDQFKATYRGRDVEDPEPLDLASIKRVSFMARSFFGQQDGDFNLVIRAISATSSIRGAADNNNDDADSSDDEDDLQKPTVVEVQQRLQRRPWWKRMMCGLV